MSYSQRAQEVSDSLKDIKLSPGFKALWNKYLILQQTPVTGDKQYAAVTLIRDLIKESNRIGAHRMAEELIRILNDQGWEV